jgi:hypothetical protein
MVRQQQQQQQQCHLTERAIVAGKLAVRAAPAAQHVSEREGAKTHTIITNETWKRKRIKPKRCFTNPSNACLQMPQVSSLAFHVHVDTACQLLICSFIQFVVLPWT